MRLQIGVVGHRGYVKRRFAAVDVVIGVGLCCSVEIVYIDHLPEKREV